MPNPLLMNEATTVERSPLRLQPDPPSLSRLDMSRTVQSDVYQEQIRRLQLRLKEVALCYRAQGRRAVVVFEGGDAAGKGGAIRRMSWPLDPRGLKVWPIAAPTDEEKGQHYLYRFWKRLPRPGQIVIFDRSWYGRVLVERVEGFATEPEWRRAYAEINEFERMLADDGICLVKVYLHITNDEQLRRFRARLNDPLKRWKLSGEDLRNRRRWDEHIEAIEDMFCRTSTIVCPWRLIPSNDKKYSRLAVIEAVVERMASGLRIEPPTLDPEFEAELRAELGL